MKEIIKLENIKKSFGPVKVLEHFNLSVHQGEFITILGPSGCGKTTLLRLIAGLETVDEGNIYIEGKDVTQQETHQRKVNMVFQSYALFPFMSVADNVGYSLKIRKVKKAEREKAITQALQLVQLAGYEKRMPDQLSGGQKQRVAIARAIVNQSNILLLDEPLSALDANLRQQMQKELKQLQKKLGITFIYITHDQEEALNMSNRIVVMNEGNIEQIGTPQQIYNQPRNEYVARFVGKANILHFDKTIALRSEWVHVQKEPKENSHPGTVLEHEFTMGMEKLTIQLEDGQRIEARASEFENIQENDTVYVSWNPAKAWPLEEASHEN